MWEGAQSVLSSRRRSSRVRMVKKGILSVRGQDSSDSDAQDVEVTEWITLPPPKTDGQPDKDRLTKNMMKVNRVFILVG